MYMSSLNLNVKQAENVYILYTEKDNTYLEKKFMQYFIVPRGFRQNNWQNIAQLTISGNETVATSILRSSASSSSNTCGLNPCKITLKEFIFCKVADQTRPGLSLQLH